MSKLAKLESRLAWRFLERRIQAVPMSSLEDRQPVFLLFTPRSGSKHFLSLLDSIPGAAFDFEILGNVALHASRMYFGPFRKNARKRLGGWVQSHQTGPHFLRPSFGSPVFSSKAVCLSYVSRCLQKLESPICAVKLQFEHLQLGGVTPADLHDAFPTARFVLLYRRSLAQQLTSDVLRHLTGSVGSGASREHRETDLTIRLSPAKVRSYFAAVRAINEEWIKLPVLQEHGAVVCYEDLCEDAQGTFERAIFPLLGLSPTPVANRRFRKQTTRTIETIIENHDEVAHLLEAPEAFQDYKLDPVESADS